MGGDREESNGKERREKKGGRREVGKEQKRKERKENEGKGEGIETHNYRFKDYKLAK